jgi:hypothetical protein
MPALPAASGPTSNDFVCLTNSNAYCTSVDPIAIYNAVLNTVIVAKVVWDWINKGKGDGGQEGEEQSEGDKEGGGDAGLCLAQTDPNPITGYTGDVYLTTCGANGTVWIAVPHSDGYYLESRWWYDHGVQNEVLSTGSPANNTPIFVAPASGNYWHTWSWYS